MQDVEVQRWDGEGSTRAFGWTVVGIAEALRLDGPFRCPECQKRVRIHRALKTAPIRPMLNIKSAVRPVPGLAITSRS